jgi:hypothetical protein
LVVTITHASFSYGRQEGLRLVVNGPVLFSGEYASQGVIPTCRRDTVVQQAIVDAILDEVMLK